MPKLQKITYSLNLIVFLFLFHATTRVQAQGTIDKGNAPSGIKDFQGLLERIIEISVTLAFMALTVIIFYAGFKFITSGGDQKNLASSRQIIIQAILGIAFLALAWLVLILIQSFTGANVTKFCIGWPGSGCLIGGP